MKCKVYITNNICADIVEQFIPGSLPQRTNFIKANKNDKDFAYSLRSYDILNVEKNINII